MQQYKLFISFLLLDNGADSLHTFAKTSEADIWLLWPSNVRRVSIYYLVSYALITVAVQST